MPEPDCPTPLCVGILAEPAVRFPLELDVRRWACNDDGAYCIRAERSLSRRRYKGAATGAGRRRRRRAVSQRNQGHRQPAPSAHPAIARLGAGRRPGLLRHAVHRGRVAAGSPHTRASATGRRCLAHHARGGECARLCASAWHHPSRYQAREYPVARRPGAPISASRLPSARRRAAVSPKPASRSALPVT
jgi:hypothetical protein